MHWWIAAGLAIVSVVGMLLTLISLPGTWVIVLAACGVKLIWPGVLGWWTLGAILALAVLAEVAEFFASAAGAAKRGGSRAGLLGSVVGGLAGALIGTVMIPIPIVGTVLGGILGAAGGAFLAERGVSERSWKEASSIATGAAIGRALSTVIKSVFAAAIGVIVVVGAVVS
ncbi:MAG: DUF456 domain-containing protein [Planctomycetota bacterium]